MTDDTEITLTRTERWILANQYRILEALYPDNSWHTRKREALENGFEGEYGFALGYIKEDTLDPDACDEVLDIINMYEALARVPEDSTIPPEDVTFAGFDQYTELPQNLYFAYRQRHGLTEGMRGYKSLDRKEPQLPKYRAMLQAWKASADPESLTPQDVQRILAENAP